MIKRIVMGVLLAGLIGALVTGAVVRTADRTERVAEARGLKSSEEQSKQGDDPAQDCEERNGQAGQGRGQRGGGVGGSKGDEAHDGEGRDGAPGDGTGTGQAQVDEWIVLQGTVVSVDQDALVVQTEEAGRVTVENRPWWFAQEQGFSAQVGDVVALVGFYENGGFEVGQLSNDTRHQTVEIREPEGRPLWAGRGRRGG
jgi:hypothetical protein